MLEADALIEFAERFRLRPLSDGDVEEVIPADLGFRKKDDPGLLNPNEGPKGVDVVLCDRAGEGSNVNNESLITDPPIISAGRWAGDGALGREDPPESMNDGPKEERACGGDLKAKEGFVFAFDDILTLKQVYKARV